MTQVHFALCLDMQSLVEVLRLALLLSLGNYFRLLFRLHNLDLRGWLMRWLMKVHVCLELFKLFFEDEVLRLQVSDVRFLLLGVEVCLDGAVLFLFQQVRYWGHTEGLLGRAADVPLGPLNALAQSWAQDEVADLLHVALDFVNNGRVKLDDGSFRVQNERVLRKSLRNKWPDCLDGRLELHELPLGLGLGFFDGYNHVFPRRSLLVVFLHVEIKEVIFYFLVLVEELGSWLGVQVNLSQILPSDVIEANLGDGDVLGRDMLRRDQRHQT